MPKRILTGKVVSSNANKTLVVRVTKRVQHKLYKKIIIILIIMNKYNKLGFLIKRINVQKIIIEAS